MNSIFQHQLYINLSKHHGLLTILMRDNTDRFHRCSGRGSAARMAAGNLDPSTNSMLDVPHHAPK